MWKVRYHPPDRRLLLNKHHTITDAHLTPFLCLFVTWELCRAQRLTHTRLPLLFSSLLSVFITLPLHYSTSALPLHYPTLPYPCSTLLYSTFTSTLPLLYSPLHLLSKLQNFHVPQPRLFPVVQAGIAQFFSVSLCAVWCVCNAGAGGCKHYWLHTTHVVAPHARCCVNCFGNKQTIWPTTWCFAVKRAALQWHRGAASDWLNRRKQSLIAQGTLSRRDVTNSEPFKDPQHKNGYLEVIRSWIECGL